VIAFLHSEFISKHPEELRGASFSIN